MRQVTSLILCFTVFFYTPAFASTPIPNLKDMKSVARPFLTAQNFYQFMDAAAPELRIQTKQWIEFFATNHFDLKSVSLQQMRVEGNSLFVGDNPTPFELRSDGKTFVYNGVAVTFDIYEKPEVTYKKMQKAWGQFRELGLSQKTAGSIGLLLPVANAQSNAGQAFVAGLSLMALLGTLAYIGVAEGIKSLLIFLAVLVGIGPVLVVGTIAAIAYIDIKFHESSSFIGVKLVCDKGEGDLHDVLADGKTSRYTSSWNTLVQYTDQQRQQAYLGFNKICEAGPAAVDKFNDALFISKAKIRNGDLGGFVPTDSPANATTSKSAR